MSKLLIIFKLIIFIWVGIYTVISFAEPVKFITIASTTSTQNSGFFDYILPIYHKKSSIDIHVVAVGTGAAINLAKNGDADILLVHHKASEIDFVTEGYGVKRFDLMYNDFIIIGHKEDPANIKNSYNITDVFKKIAKGKHIFISRGDNSGTYKKEIELWQNANINPSLNNPKWYRATGSGMGASINIATSMDGYILSDRATWLSFANKGDLKNLYAGDRRLFNQYGIILVNKNKYPHIKSIAGQGFINWLLSSEGQNAIAAFKLNGQQLFYPNSKE